MKNKVVRITTIPLSLEKLLEGQLNFMSEFFEMTAVSSDKERLNNYGKKEGIDVYHLEMTRKITPFKDFIAIMKFYKFLLTHKPQIVHSHTPKAGFISMIASFLARVPIRLHTVAGLPLMEAKGFKRIILNSVESLTYLCATKIYANSIGLMEFILNERYTSSKKIDVIGKGSSNGINLSYFNYNIVKKSEKEELRKKYDIAENDFVFLYVGRIVGDKGINELVESFDFLSKNYLNSKLLLVGNLENHLDPIKENTEKLICYNDKIICTGYQKDVRPFFAISDVFVFPSYREGFPNVVLQSCAMSIHVITTDINACNALIKDNFNGLIIPPKNLKKLREAMEVVINSPSKLSFFKSNTFKSIQHNFNQIDIWNLLKEEYRLNIEKIHK